nr:diacylglycerol kinase 5-like [Tanacetum cinerariifolium]
MDKEPWKQTLPRQEDIVTIEISHFGQVSMLASGNYPSKSVNNPLTPRTPRDGDYDSDKEEAEEIFEERKSLAQLPVFNYRKTFTYLIDEEEAEEIFEERKKFGATSSFQLPEDFHISHKLTEEHEKIFRNPENKESGLWSYMERIYVDVIHGSVDEKLLNDVMMSGFLSKMKLSKWDVIITSEMPDNELIAHVISSNDDHASHTIPFKRTYDWSFCESFFGRASYHGDA